MFALPPVPAPTDAVDAAAPNSNERTPPKVHATIIKQPQTGVDESTTMLLEFAKSHTHGVCSSNVRAHPCLASLPRPSC